MKILHTSDWHLGQSLLGYDRCSEEADVMRQLAAIVAAEKPDALVVAGDVFHNAMPSNAASKTYVDGVLALHQACPAMAIVIIAGNHDSAARLGAYGRLWQLAGVTIAASQQDAMRPVTAGNGVIVPVAYQHPADVHDIATQAINAARQEAPAGAPIIAVAHQAISGADYNGHYRQPYVDDAITLAQAGLDGADYVALGHIHRPQFVTDSSYKARYCGTPLPVHFDEATCELGVDIVEIDRAGTTPRVRQIAITTPVPLLTIPDEPAPLDDALAAMEALPEDQTCYIRLNVLLNDKWLAGDAKTRASDIAMRSIGSDGLPMKRFCEFRITRDHTVAGSDTLVTADIDELTRMEPVEAAERYLKRNGLPQLTPDELNIFKTLDGMKGLEV